MAAHQRRHATRLEISAVWHVYGMLFVAAVVLATILDPMLGRFIPRHGVGNWVVATSRVWLIATFLGYLGVTAVGTLELLSTPTLYAFPPSRREGIDQSRRAFFRYAAYALGSIPFVAATYGFGNGRLRYRVEKVDVPIANLPKSLDGLRIVQISDVHFGDFMPQADLRRAIEMANDFAHVLLVIHHFIKIFGPRIGVMDSKLRKQGTGLVRKFPHGPNGFKSVRFETANNRTQHHNPAGLNFLDCRSHLLPHWIPQLARTL